MSADIDTKHRLARFGHPPGYWASAPHKVEVHCLKQAQVHHVVVIERHFGQAEQACALLLQPLA